MPNDVIVVEDEHVNFPTTVRDYRLPINYNNYNTHFQSQRVVIVVKRLLLIITDEPATPMQLYGNQAIKRELVLWD